MIREEKPDYGVDASVEVVTETGAVTGKRFFVQLKSTDGAKPSEALRVKLKIKTFRYLQGLDIPVLVVLYHAPTRQLYARWVHEMDVFYAQRSAAHFTFHFDTSDVLAGGDGQTKLEQDLDDWRWIHAPTLQGPLLLQLNAHASSIRGVKTSSVAADLERMAAPLREVLKIQQVPLGRVRGEIDASADDLAVRLYGGGGAAIHKSLKEARSRTRKRSGGVRRSRKKRAAQVSEIPSTAKEVAADILAAIALAVHHAGHLKTAADIAEEVLSVAAVSQSPAVLGQFVRLLIEAGRREALVRAAIDFRKDGHLIVSEMIVGSVVLTPAPLDGRGALAAALEEWLATAPTDEGPVDNGTAHYNVGRYIGTRGWDIRSGVAHFVKAAKLDPSYRTRAYFWNELGAMFFHLERFVWSARAYGMAAELGQGADTYARQADALWRSGRYGKALDALTNYVGEDAHWSILRLLLPGVIEDTGTTEQLRDPLLAEKYVESAFAVDSSEERREWLMRAIVADGMSALAWYNLGLARGASGAHEEATAAFLVVAMIQPWDTEAWANAIRECVAWSKADPAQATFAEQLFGVIAMAGAQYDREGLFRLLLERMVPDTTEGRQLLRQLFGELPMTKENKRVLRLIIEGKTLELPVDNPEKAFQILGEVDGL
jgi:tetratricopeptide (TPR) repeat protein